VVASCESKKATSCRRMACRYRCLIRSTCLSLVRLQQYPSACVHTEYKIVRILAS
jgi:hypothetical protein